MVITVTKLKIAIICDGIREDATLNQTAIIDISANCIIKTKKNILTPRRSETVTVLGAFIRPVQLNLNTLQPAKELTMTPYEEQVVDASDQLSQLQDEEQDIDQQIQDAKWTPVHHHLVISSSIILVTLGIIATLVIWLHFRKTDTQPTSRHVTTNEEALTLEPLHSVEHFPHPLPRTRGRPASPTMPVESTA